MRDFYEHKDRLILVDNGSSGWAWGSEGKRWLPISPEFAATVWAEGKKLTQVEAVARYGIAPADLPAQSA